MTTSPPRLVPLWIKVSYTAFMAVLIPVYLKMYGPTNFLYFCDVAAIMTLVAVWTESSLLASAAIVGIFLPQMLWVADFFVELSGSHLTGMTSYMFKPPFFLRFLSFFHFWLPFLLLYLIWCVGYDRRGLVLWMAASWILVTICYVYLPLPGSFPDNPNMPVNVNYVYGLSEDKSQEWMEPNLYFATYLTVLMLGIYLPTHFLLVWLMPNPRVQPRA